MVKGGRSAIRSTDKSRLTKSSTHSRRTGSKMASNADDSTLVFRVDLPVKPTRRFVKGTVPQPTSVHLQVDAATESKEDKDDSDIKERAPLGHYSLGDSSAVRRELVKDDAEASRKNRVKMSKTLQSAKRDKIMKEHRLNPKPPRDSPKAHPFSRFLSAFSVAAHPELKRAWKWIMPSDMEDCREPEEKRFRVTESALDGADEAPDESSLPSKEEGIRDSPSTNRSVLVTTVAVVFIAALIAWIRRK
ncbi:hypothetical protein MPSEU_000277600 [Mayamaea pseudoterrestris]|nr:hypothetical protein MPSEU_000277600 [Mayamaea pseudoterrestris]